MIRAEADAAGHTRLTTLRSQVPLVLRPTADAVYLAAGAAGPLGGDELEVSVWVGPGAQLTLRTVGATLALPGNGESSMTWRLHVAARGTLAVLPEPTIVAAAARYHTRTEIHVEAGGALTLREEALLGRHGESGGSYRSTLRVDVADAPLLRHELCLDGADPSTFDLGSVIGARACGSLLLVGAEWTDIGAGPPASADVAVLPLAGPGVLVTALADDGRTLRGRLECLEPARTSVA
jgi:urease accessory protein